MIIIVPLIILFVLFFVVGDLSTTYVGSHGTMYNEQNPAAKWLYSNFGWAGIVGFKLLCAAGIIGVSIMIWPVSRLGSWIIMLIGIVFGGVLVANNLSVILG